MADSVLSKMEKAMENWDGTWLWRFTGEDEQVYDNNLKELGWYDTKEEAVEALTNLVNSITKEHPNCEARVICHGRKAAIYARETDAINMYILEVYEVRSCFKDL